MNTKFDPRSRGSKILGKIVGKILGDGKNSRNDTGWPAKYEIFLVRGISHK